MASRFWVGGDGVWDSTSTANWSATTGGASGASAPTTADDAFFDSNSGTGTCTVDATAVCRDTTVNSSTLVLSYGANCTLTRTLILTSGSINVNGNTITAVAFSSTNSNIRSLNFGVGGKLICSSTSAPWNTNTATNLTISGTGTLDCTDNSASARSILFGTLVESSTIDVNVTAGTGAVTLTGSVKNVNFTGFAGSLNNGARSIFGNLTLSSGMTLAAGTSTTTFGATSGTQQITTNGKTLDFPITQNSPGATLQLQDNLTMGSTRTFTLTAGTLDLNNQTLSTGLFACSTSSTTRSVAFGTGNITLTQNNATILAWGNSNLTATGSKNIFATYAGATGTRTFSMNSTGLTETNTPNILITAGTDTIASIARVRTLDFTGFKGTYNSAVTKLIFGGLIFDPGMTITGSTNNHAFGATTGPYTIKTAGLVMDFPITFSGVAIGGIWEFDDAITMGAGRTLTVNAGTVKFKAGTTNTSGTFSFVGTSAPGRQISIQSTTPGVQYTLSQPSGTVNAAFMDIQDSNATGGATWNAFVDQGNIDAGNNDGWDFGISPIVGGNEYTYQLRSFTQPRRF